MISTDLHGLPHTCWQRNSTKHFVGTVDGLGTLGYVGYVVVPSLQHVGRTTGSPELNIFELVFPTLMMYACMYLHA